MHGMLPQVRSFKQIGQKVGKESPSLSFPTYSAVHNLSTEQQNSEVLRDTEQSLSPRKKPLASLYRSGLGFSVKDKKTEVSMSKVTKVVGRQNRWTLWLLAYVAIVTTWPLVGSALFLHGKMRFKNVYMKLMSK